ncbi:flavodoxin [Hydrotalea sp.]|uniref:flavodoxin family protein n=1 Tax=Hydrotalea sp. TaxID=2881279 RepID=UPI002621CCE0|nr:flavodoxin [Hydrotalea sp.]
MYFSRTNNTQAVATMIHELTGGKLVALELEKPYPTNYQQTVQEVVQQNKTGYLPALKTRIDSLYQYHVVFIGFPTWDMQLPPPVKSFLQQYHRNLKEKTIIPFNTNAGYGVGSSFEQIKTYCSQSKVLEGFNTTGGIERDGIYLDIKNEKAVAVKAAIRQWLIKISILK